MTKYLVKSIGNKKWLWFKATNNYIQVEKDIFRVFEKLQEKKTIEEVINWCADCYNLSIVDAHTTVLKIDALLCGQLKAEKPSEKEEVAIESPISFFSIKSYHFNGIDFRFFYGNAKIETMIHPLFAHLTTDSNKKKGLNIRLFFLEESYVLNIDGTQIGSWPKQEDHVFKGQIFMAILNAAYKKTEKDWLGVLHASAIGNDQNSVLFLGDSGNGKSTATAITLASGLSLIADDFVPIDTHGHILAFPAAISIKKQALDLLAKHFPQLLKAQEYDLKAMDKKVRYLAPSAIKNNPRQVKALIFIQYTTEIDFELEPMDIHIAFQHLVVDSWLSPEEKNARFFMDWIVDMPAYRLRYSNNQKMLATVKNLLSYD